ncbi:uncharacterized protein BKCO1_2600020 [Diplodia corticola]|uniref:Uncharacterized protein n=1 Tax=Diplodia corticola TaxID=236234 RepID=A0A1J9RMW4_9PEZI|nr:uncharacterized protein BKCO1_2600020 [Diplodia corticola]OJD33915.1 hypothetical protein BKCO1_2600020 [Diplodia corticola]
MSTPPASPNAAPIPRHEQHQHDHPRRRTLEPTTARARLLELPAELRRMVLAEALHDPAGVRVAQARVSSMSPVLPTLAALLLVSRRVHDEALQAFASSNHFFVDNADGLLCLLRLVGPHARPHLRRADVAFARPTGCGFIDAPDALTEALAVLEADEEESRSTRPRLSLTVELALRAVQAPWNHAHARENEHCHHYPESAKNKAGKNFWIHPASVRDTPHADDLKRLVARAVAVRWSGSPQYSWSSAADDSLDFVRKSEAWLRSADEPGFEYICSWEVLPPTPLTSAKSKDDGVLPSIPEPTRA